MDNEIGTAVTFNTIVGVRNRLTIPPHSAKLGNVKPTDFVEVTFKKIKSGETDGEKS